MHEFKYNLFSVYGIELEYMIVDKKTLNIMPCVDKLFHELSGRYVDEISFGEIAWNNELVLHVLEMKTNGPTDTLNGLDKLFHKNIIRANNMLEKYGAILMPTGAHPWMNPKKEMRLWPHGNHDIYESYHRIFNCEGHGWSNLQSVHINLPFKNDFEFVKLHQAIRVALAIIPTLTASTPILDGKVTGFCDTRLKFYGNNQKAIPIISGLIIPEAINSIDDYYETILNPIYQAIEEYDILNVLQEEWLNSRGAIARFERGAIEIRIVDIQESAKADVSCIYAIVGLIKYLCASEHKLDLETAVLREIFDSVIKNGSNTVILNSEYLNLFSCSKPLKANELWEVILENFITEIPDDYREVLKFIMKYGNLSERILSVIERNGIKFMPEIYQQLITCLSNNKIYQGV